MKKYILLLVVSMFHSVLDCAVNMQNFSALQGSVIDVRTRPHSPIMGYLSHQQVRNALNDKTDVEHDLATLLFNINPDNLLRDIQLNSSPLKFATAEQIAQLLQVLEVENSIEDFFKTDCFADWYELHKSYGGHGDIARFKQPFRYIHKAVKKIQLAEGGSDENYYRVIRNYFGLLAYFKIRQSRDAINFYRKMGINFKSSNRKIRSIVPHDIDLLSDQAIAEEFENAFGVFMTEGLNFLVVPPLEGNYKEQKQRPLCVERVILNLLLIILYDFKDGKINFSNIPSELNISKNLKQFFVKYSNPKIADYYSIIMQEWIDLVSNVPGIQYLTASEEGNYELSPYSIVPILNYLLGVRAKDLLDFARIVSTPQQKVVINAINDQKYSISVEGDSSLISGEIEIMPGHANFMLDRVDNKKSVSLDQAKYVWNISKKIMAVHTLLILLDDAALFNIINEGIISGDYQSVKEILDARGWNLLVERNGRTLFSVAAQSSEMLKLFVACAKKQGIQFGTREYNSAFVVTLSRGVNVFRLLLKLAENEGIVFSQESFDRALPVAVLSRERLSVLINCAIKQGMYFGSEAFDKAYEQAMKRKDVEVIGLLDKLKNQPAIGKSIARDMVKKNVSRISNPLLLPEYVALQAQQQRWGRDRELVPMIGF